LRFKEIVMHFKYEILELVALYQTVINNAITYMFSILDMVSFEDGQYEEWDGIAEAMEISTNKIMMANYLYELDAYCTSFIA
jgi:hypothetical protein